MKGNMTFLAPLLGGIIVGLSGMITLILSALKVFVDSGIGGSGSSMAGVNIDELTGLFYVGNMVPTFWLQIIVGVYLIQIAFILTETLITIQAGSDNLATVNETGKNLKSTIVLYSVVSLISICLLSAVAAFALRGLTG